MYYFRKSEEHMDLSRIYLAVKTKKGIDFKSKAK